MTKPCRVDNMANPDKKEHTKSGFELDCICARHIYCFTQKPGVCKKAKKALNKRHRRDNKPSADDQ